MPRLSLAAAILLVPLGLDGSFAIADYPVRQAILTCDATANRALLTFDAGSEALPELPPEVASSWSGLMPAENLTCTLADGREVKARTGSEQAQSYGMCGADPGHFFSLWVDGKKVLSRVFFYGGCFAGFLERAVVLDGDRLTGCQILRAKDMLAGEQPARYGGVQCADQSELLRQAIADPVEYPASGAPPRAGALEVSQWSDAAYCAELIARGEAGEHWDNLTYWWSGGDTFRIETSGAPLDKFPRRARIGRGWIYDVDIDSDGTPESLYWERGENGVFDGDYLIVGQSGQPVAPLVGENLSGTIKAARDAGMMVIAGDRTPFEDVRITHFTPVVTRDGKLLLWSWPVNLSRTPAAILYVLGPQGELSALCTFTRVLENF